MEEKKTYLRVGLIRLILTIVAIAGLITTGIYGYDYLYASTGTILFGWVMFEMWMQLNLLLIVLRSVQDVIKYLTQLAEIANRQQQMISHQGREKDKKAPPEDKDKDKGKGVPPFPLKMTSKKAE